MFCNNCGKPQEKDNLFCASCGKALEQQDDANKEVGADKKAKSEKSSITLVSFGCIVGAVIGVFLLLNLGGVFNDPAADVIAALENDEYLEALLLVAELPDNAIESLQNKLSGRIETLFEEFFRENIEYSIAIMELNTIERMNFHELLPELNNVRGRINNINLSRISFHIAEELFSRGDYLGALEEYRHVILDDPNFYIAQERINNVIYAYRAQVLNKIVGIHYEDIIRTLHNELRILENDPEFMQILTITEQSYVIATITEANSLLAQNKFSEAIEEINNALLFVPNDERLTSKIAEVSTTFVAVTISEADYLLSQRKFDDATAIIHNALGIVPNNEQLRSKIDVINARRPVSITELTSISGRSGRFVPSNRTRDNYQNVHVNVITFPNIIGGTFHTLLDGRYTRLRGTLFVRDGETNHLVHMITAFELDGRILEAHAMGKTCRPISIDIDLSGGNEFRIITESSNRSWAFPIHFADFRLYP